MSSISTWLSYLLLGLEQCVLALEGFTLQVESSVFSLMDIAVYSLIITLTLKFISSHYSSISTSKHKVVYRKGE